MQRYKQKYIEVGPMVKSDTGDWVKYKEFEDTLNVNEESWGEIVKERNTEIDILQKDCQHFGDDNIELEHKNTKLFSLLVMSTVFNFVSIVAAVFFIIDIMGIA
jgi:hypothetical protein